MEETLYQKIKKELDHPLIPEMLWYRVTDACTKVAIQAQIDLMNKMRDVLDIPQDQHERYIEEIQELEKQLNF